MPNQSHSGFRGDPWHRCDRCGFEFPVSELTRQRGLILCQKDIDNPQVWERDSMIKEALGNGEPDLEVADILKSPTQNDDDYYF